MAEVDTTIGDLIELGRRACEPGADVAGLVQWWQRHGKRRFRRDLLETAAEELKDGDLISLTRGVALAERQFSAHGGSIAAAIWLFARVERRCPDHADALAEWLFLHSENPWLPFNSHRRGARTLEEYREAKRAREQRRLASAARHAREEEAAAARRSAREARRRERAIDHEKWTRDRRAALEVLAPLAPAERLARIAADDAHPIVAWPAEWAEVDEAVLESLDDATRQRLAERLAGRRKGAWADLGRRLRARDGGAGRAS